MKPFYLCLIVSFFLGTFCNAQNLPQSWYKPNGSIETMFADSVNNLLYVGGNFNWFYPPETNPYGASIDLISGQSDQQFQNPNGVVHCVVSDGNGGFFIGGEFTQVGDSLRTKIAHLNINGEVTSWNPMIVDNGNTVVTAMCISGSTLYIGGLFSTVQNQSRVCLAALDIVSGNLTSWNASSSDRVKTLVVSNGYVYAGGMGFYSSPSSGFGNNYAARFDEVTGMIDPNWNPQINLTVSTIKPVGNNVYLGGIFSSINSVVRTGLARVSAIDGTLDSWNPELVYYGSSGDPLSPIVDEIEYHDSKIFIVGGFQEINGANRSHIAAFDEPTGQLDNWSLIIDGRVNKMSFNSQELLITGEFGFVEEKRHSRIARVHLMNGVLNWDPGIEDLINDFDVYANTIYIGGSFLYTDVIPRLGLAAINTNTGIPNSWNPATDVYGKVKDILVQDSIVYLGGLFSTLDGTDRKNLASYNLLTDTLTDWDPQPDSTVHSILLLDDKLLVGGSFEEISGITRSHFAAFEHTSSTLLNWNPSPDGTVHLLKRTGNFLNIGGNFNSIDGEIRHNLARYSTNSLLLEEWAPEFDSTVLTICEKGDDLLIGGNFNSVNGISRNYVASVNSSTGFLNPLNLNPDYSVNKIERVNGYFYIAGRFQNIGNQNRMTVAQFDGSTELITPWNIPNNGFSEAFDIVEIDSLLYVSGDYMYAIIESDSVDYSLLELSATSYSFPSLSNDCTGSVYFTATGAPDFTFIIDGGIVSGNSNGFIAFDSLCSGIHSFATIDYYNDTLYSTFIIPTDSNYLLINPLSNTIINDLLGVVQENCEINYNEIDSIYIQSAYYSNDSLIVVWTIETTSGVFQDSSTYLLTSGNGNYYLQLSIFCPTKALGDYFTVTQAIYFEDGNVSTASLAVLDDDLFQLFPNPTNELVTIRFEASKAELVIYDAQGKLVQTQTIQSSEVVSLGQLETGIYFFELTTGTGRSMKRVVKQ